MAQLKVLNVEGTPNPDALKFHVDQALSSNGVKQFDNAEAANGDALVKTLFGLPGVQSVFYGGEFVTISKQASTLWNDLEPKVIEAIQSYVPPKPESAVSSEDKPKSSGDALLDQINEVIDQNVRPPLENDGGGIEILSLDGYVLTVHYMGACGSCPSAQTGTIMAIQNLLQAMVDSRIQVVAA